MYYNEKHKKLVEERGDGYTYIGSYRCGEITIDGKKSDKCSQIRVRCPYCRSEYDIRLSNFNKGDICALCCNSYEKSFAYYIQQELGEPLNKYWDWEKNTVNPYCITSQSHKKVYVKCDRTDYHGSYLVSLHNFYNGSRCPYCCNYNGKKIHPKDSFAQWGIDTFGEDFLEKYWSSKNIINPWEIAPQSNKKVWMLCQEHEYHNDNGGYETRCASFYNGHKCPYCTNCNGKIHLKDSFGSLYPDKAKYWSPNNKKSPFEVTPKSGKKYKFICEECGNEFERSLEKLNRADTGVFCEECNSSQLEIKTKDILVKYNVKYNSQVEYNGLIGLGNGNLSYDFYLSDYNLLIECQGEQHERFIKGLHKTKEDFEKQLEHDKRKREYAKKNNIDLLEIWYYDVDNIEEILIEKLHIKNN